MFILWITVSLIAGLFSGDNHRRPGASVAVAGLERFVVMRRGRDEAKVRARAAIEGARRREAEPEEANQLHSLTRMTRGARLPKLTVA
jgi:hypothetical protein